MITTQEKLIDQLRDDIRIGVSIVKDFQKDLETEQTVFMRDISLGGLDKTLKELELNHKLLVYLKE